MATGPICPTCKRHTKTHPENPAAPFCSRQCKLADLSNWFSERYAVASEPANPDDIPEPEMLN